MGGGSSKTTSKIFAESFLKISSQFESNTSQSGSGVINIENSTIGDGAHISQLLQVKQQAIAKALAQSDLSTLVTNEAKQAASAESSALGVAISNNENELKKTFETAITHASKNILAQVGTAALNIKNSTIGKGVTVDQAVKMIQDSVFQALNNDQSFTKAATAVDLQAQNSFSLLNVFGKYTWVIILIAVLVGAWYFIGGGKMPSFGGSSPGAAKTSL